MILGKLERKSVCIRVRVFIELPSVRQLARCGIGQAGGCAQIKERPALGAPVSRKCSDLPRQREAPHRNNLSRATIG